MTALLQTALKKKMYVSGHWSSFLGGKLNEIARARFLGLFFPAGQPSPNAKYLTVVTTALQNKSIFGLSVFLANNGFN